MGAKDTSAIGIESFCEKIGEAMLKGLSDVSQQIDESDVD